MMHEDLHYTWYMTDQTAGMPFRMAHRAYYTDEEKDIICERSKRSGEKCLIFKVPSGDNIYTREIARLQSAKP